MHKICLVGGPFHNTMREVAESTVLHRFALVMPLRVSLLEAPPYPELKAHQSYTFHVDYERVSYRSNVFRYVQVDPTTMTKDELLHYARLLEASISFMNAGITGE